ncbi:MAG: AAA family ATPase, partial [Fusobacteriaceae bacterium]
MNKITIKDNELQKYVKSKRPIIWTSHYDYAEIDNLIRETVKDIDHNIFEYRSVGEVDFDTKSIKDDGAKELLQMLKATYDDGMETNVFLVVKNVDTELKDPKVLGFLRKIAEMNYASKKYSFTTIIVSNEEEIPLEIERYVSIVNIKPMEQEELESYIVAFGKLHDIDIDKGDLGELSIFLKGLSKLDINHVLNMLAESKGKISASDDDRRIIIKEKGQIVKKTAILELIDFKEKIADIGGLESLKDWLQDTAEIFKKLDEAQKFGLDIPKGALLVGMPGCGKSLAAKATARALNAPLLRLDIGRLLGKYVGESEKNMRIALKMAESISPCILWIDEIEKAFAGIDQSGGASDITKRLFGHFLTWLQEKENTVFVVATANELSSFPPEFLRKGRFDEIFYVDFPNEREREDIFRIHLEKRGKYSQEINLKELAKNSDGFSGADIEETVKTA